ncbi:MAG: LacI family DNA-binding transcriptional regulator [Opitutaceae bacterium]|jgi:LacI family transcriptional regulator
MYSHPTIRDVARVAGVHFTTVSMALRGHAGIPAVTRDRIVAVASRIGYVRNRVFAALSNQRSNKGGDHFRPRIAYLTNRSPEEGFLMYWHFQSLIAGARRQAEALGYDFEVLFIDKGYHNSQTLGPYLKKNSITGVIIGAFEPDRAEIELDWNEFCAVKIDSRHMKPPLNFVASDQMNDVRDAHAHLYALGYRRIGLAVGQVDEESTDGLHLSGLILARQDHPSAEPIPPLFFPHGTTEKSAIPLIRSYVIEHGLDVILCNWTNIRNMIERAGFECPREVACACVCLPRRTRNLAGIVTNLEGVGERVTSLLVALLRMEQKGVPDFATRTYVRGKWSDGSSASPRARKD